MELLEYALSVIGKAQGIVGGRVAFIECQDKPKFDRLLFQKRFQVF
jgi:hypothetical protein